MAAKVTKSQANALHLLCLNYKGFRIKEIVELLVDGGIDPTDKAIDGLNALHFLCRHFEGPNLKEIVFFNVKIILNNSQQQK